MRPLLLLGGGALLAGMWTAAGHTIAMLLFVAVSVAIAVHARFNTALAPGDQIPPRPLIANRRKET